METFYKIFRSTRHQYAFLLKISCFPYDTYDFYDVLSDFCEKIFLSTTCFCGPCDSCYSHFAQAVVGTNIQDHDSFNHNQIYEFINSSQNNCFLGVLFIGKLSQKNKFWFLV